MLSTRVNNLKESATLAMNAKATLLKRQGQTIHNFSAGEPDFSTPYSIVQAGIAALNENFTKYTSASGISELKTAICKKFQENGIQCNEKEVTITNGGKQALFNAIIAIINKNDEIIVPKPYWVSYLDQVKLAEGIPIIAETDNFQVKADLITEKITSNTKAIIINSPCNPTGGVIEPDELRKIADLAIKHGLMVISDEVYEKIIYDQDHLSIASLSKEMQDRTITINSFSKTYSMTGIRIGYCQANQEIINAMNKIQGQTTSNVCSIAQKMALAALKLPPEEIQQMVSEFKKRRDFLVEELNNMGLQCQKPHGAFYVFPSIKSTQMTSMEFCDRLLEHGVAAVPGIAFGQNDHIRISYSVSMEEIQDGLKKIRELIGGL